MEIANKYSPEDVFIIQILYMDEIGISPPDVEVLRRWEERNMGGVKLTGGILDWSHISYHWEHTGVPQTTIIETKDMSIVVYGYTVDVEAELEKLGIDPL